MAGSGIRGWLEPWALKGNSQKADSGVFGRAKCAGSIGPQRAAHTVPHCTECLCLQGGDGE